MAWVLTDKGGADPSMSRWIDFCVNDEDNTATIHAANCERIDLPRAGILFDCDIGLNTVVVNTERARKAWNELVDMGFTKYI